MATRNDVTGQEIKSRGNSESYKSNWDAIFGKKEVEQSVEVSEKSEDNDGKETQ